MTQPTPTPSTSRRRTSAALPPALLADLNTKPAPLAASPGLLHYLGDWLRTRREVATGKGRLRVAETVSLGEKRFVSIVHVDGQRFLIGGSASNVGLLTPLEAASDGFGDALRKATRSRKRKPMASMQENA